MSHGSQPTLIADAKSFLATLTQNNTRDWFTANKDTYDSHLKTPALALLDDISPLLEAFCGDPVKPKLFRPHRDVRFSKDKTPYHLHLHMGWMLPGDRGLGYFFGISSSYVRMGAGTMAFSKDGLTRWRNAVDQDAGLIADITSLTSGAFFLDPPALKRVPAPHAKDHPQAELLKRKDLPLWRDFTAAETPKPRETLLRGFEKLQPIINRLRDIA